ncbi:MAG: UDP-N-acetylmuramoyl-L-alanyl-D-glutamate--2 6-diaminopimelate ligase [Fusobacteria bacterium]|nr:MAG: UDP-N-acetylmuramoyl-L-alanyl-D-glutamate--2 6-diaminopimelate ligase [Fusobacteriota bacterium]KAF0229946.1 MAG: UDP-N-acetylmuramoyl-L-alanyl-D-glutamate--2 6-diaminopimelate [Fusobacteriota bacterium]
MELKNLLKDIEHSVLNGDTNIDISSVEYDSRKVTTGSLFVAIKGYETDGHLYILKAIEAGAKAVILEEKSDIKYSDGIVIIKVDNSRKSLGFISSNFFGNPGNKLKIIGVTGTNGKTSITYFLKSILKEAGYKVGIIGTIENQIEDTVYESAVTTPESRDIQELLAKMVEVGCEYCVMEASSHALYLDRVAAIPFKTAIFTNLTQDHLDFHKDFTEYLNAKKILFTYIGKDGFSILNGDDKTFVEISNMAGGKIVSYSISEKSDYKAANINMDINGTSFTLINNEKSIKINLKMIGEFSIYNSLAAIATAHELGIEFTTIKEGLRKVSVNGRFQLIESNKDFAVVVDYAHTPDGLYNVLSTARKITSGRVICVFGCGGDRDKKKRPIMGKVAGENGDYLVITSDNPRTEEPIQIIDMVEEGAKETSAKYIKITNRKEAIAYAIDMARTGDIVIIAGKGHEDYQIVGKTKYPFSDFEIARNILDSKE